MCNWKLKCVLKVSFIAGFVAAEYAEHKTRFFSL